MKERNSIIVLDASIYRKTRKKPKFKGTLRILAKRGRQDFQQEREP